MKQCVRQAGQSALLRDGVRRLKLSAASGQLDEQAIAELWLGWGNPQWSATSEMLSVIAVLAMRPSNRLILECGSGISTVVMGIAAEFSGVRIVSLEADEQWHAHMVRTLDRFSLRNVEVRHAPIQRQADADWYAASALGDLEDINVFVCDGPPGDTRGGRSGAIALVSPRLASGATIIVDDVQRAPERDLAARFREVVSGTEIRWGRPSRQFTVVESPVVVAPTNESFSQNGASASARAREPMPTPTR